MVCASQATTAQLFGSMLGSLFNAAMYDDCIRIKILAGVNVQVFSIALY